MTRPNFLRAYPSWGETEGHTEPAAVTVPGVRVLSEDGARLDLHRVTPARDWLSDEDLARLAANDEPPMRVSWPGITDEEVARRVAMRERLREIREEFRITRRQWLIWFFCAVLGLFAVAWLPNPGYGWSIGKALEVLAGVPQ